MLERKVRELRQANVILRKARRSAYRRDRGDSSLASDLERSAASVSSTCSTPSGVSARRLEAPVMVRSPATDCDLGYAAACRSRRRLSNLVMPLLKRRARHELGGDIMLGIRRRTCRNPQVEPIRFLPVEETPFREQIPES